MNKIFISIIIVLSTSLVSCNSGAFATVDTSNFETIMSENQTQETVTETERPVYLLDGYEQISLPIENGTVALPEANVTKVFVCGFMNSEMTSEDTRMLEDILKNGDILKKVEDLPYNRFIMGAIYVYFDNDTYCETSVFRNKGGSDIETYLSFGMGWYQVTDGDWKDKFIDIMYKYDPTTWGSSWADYTPDS